MYIVEENGEKYVYESSPRKVNGKSGVQKHKLDDYIKMHANRKFPIHIVDPMKSVRGIAGAAQSGAHLASAGASAVQAAAKRADQPSPLGKQGKKERFISRYWDVAQKIASRLNVPVQAVLAQFALETGWGEKSNRRHQQPGQYQGRQKTGGARPSARGTPAKSPTTPTASITAPTNLPTII